MKQFFVQVSILSLVIAVGCGGGGGGDVIPPTSGALQVTNDSSLQIDVLNIWQGSWDHNYWDNNKLSSPVCAGCDINLNDIPEGTYGVMVVHEPSFTISYNAVFYGITIVGGQTSQLILQTSSYSGSLQINNFSTASITEVYIDGVSSLPVGSSIGPSGSRIFFWLQPDSYTVELVRDDGGGSVHGATISSATITTIIEY